MGAFILNDWREVMVLGLGILRLPPEQFWAMTTPEFTAALEGYCWGMGYGFLGEGVPLGREELEELRGRFPD